MKTSRYFSGFLLAGAITLLTQTPTASTHAFERPPAKPARLAIQTSSEVPNVDSVRPWKWLESSCHDCSLQVVITNPRIQNPRVEAYVQALMDRKPELLALYKDVHGAEYNLLAHMAIGILGRESEFFRSVRYRVKEASPGVIELMKLIRYYVIDPDKGLTPNSRGPTQIKYIPEKITQAYGIEPEDLRIPENAAIATMGYLIEALSILERLKSTYDLDMVKPETISDYLPYIYFGKAYALRNKSATPDQNLYVQAMKEYMSWVELYEGPPTVQLPLPVDP